VAYEVPVGQTGDGTKVPKQTITRYGQSNFASPAGFCETA